MKPNDGIAEILEEADELVTRYAGAVSPSWERNLEVLGTLMVVHKLWQGPETTVGDLLREMMVFLRAAYRMGAASDETVEV